MKKAMLFILLFPSFAWPQYFSNRVTDKNFEQSALYFRPYFLNPWGIGFMKDLAPGMMNEPFSNIYMNPANLPQLEKNRLWYADFRSDRKEPAVTNYWRPHTSYDMSLVAPPDPRWADITRDEPEPLFTLGFMAYPVPNVKWLVGGSYALINKKENFYVMPYYIYNTRFGYDSYGGKITNDNYPITDRSVHDDALITDGHLFTFFTGYRVTPSISAGFYFNGVLHDRNGEYLNSNSEDQSTYGWSYRNYSLHDRRNKYHHRDISGGIGWKPADNAFLGMKAGYLQGDAAQKLTMLDTGRYEYTYTGSQDFNHSLNQNATQQRWDRKGRTWYAQLSGEKALSGNKTVRGYYRYELTDIDMTTRSAITDTGYYHYQWSGYNSVSHSALRDRRNSTGYEKNYHHQAMINGEYALSKKSKLIIGLFVSWNKSDAHSLEPVSAYTSSNYTYDTTGHSFRTTEIKTLDWNYKTRHWTIQTPFLGEFTLNDHWKITAGVNRIIDRWTINEETIAYYTLRQTTENGTTITRTNYGKRDRESTVRMSENRFELIANVEAAISPQFKINLTFSPDLDDHIRIAQWMVGFRTNF